MTVCSTHHLPKSQSMLARIKFVLGGWHTQNVCAPQKNSPNAGVEFMPTFCSKQLPEWNHVPEMY